jgi:uncharacterized protein
VSHGPGDGHDEAALENADPAAFTPSGPRRVLDALPAREREPVIDVLRGFAVLGILLVNIEFMRGPDAYLLFESTGPAAYDRFADQASQFVVGWLATGKFVSSFAFLFGVGAALMSERVERSGHSPRALLTRRYAWLAVFGLAHMVLLFPGDILFAYGLTGFVLLTFLAREAPELMRWGVGLLAATTLAAMLIVLPLAGSGAPAAETVEPFSSAARLEAVHTLRHGAYGDIVAFHARQALLLQSAGLFLLPWMLGLFLLGYATVRAGVLRNLRGRKALLRRGAAIGLGAGVPANLVLGFFGPLGGLAADPQAHSAAWLAAGVAAQLVAAPLLAAGYLSAVALFCLERGAVRPLAHVGRMALTAYLLQSALALLVFAGFGLYDRLRPSGALLVVAAIWGAVIAFCRLWGMRFQYGPAEWLWRSLTYGRLQSMRPRGSVSR